MRSRGAAMVDVGGARKTWSGGAVLVEPADVAAFAAATKDGNAAYRGPDAIAPPMFHVRLFKELMFRIATDGSLGLDVLRLVHGEHDVEFHHPLRVWDVVSVRAQLDGVDNKESGTVVRSRLFAFVRGEVAVEARTSYFVRGTRRGDGEPHSERDVRLAAPPDVLAPIVVDPDQSYRYAAASLDDNPIHTSAEVAAAAGLPGVIVQGMCTMAMSGAVAVEACGGDPRRLRRLAVRFKRPVLNGSSLSFVGYRRPGAIEFDVLDEQHRPVVVHGLAEFRE